MRKSEPSSRASQRQPSNRSEGNTIGVLDSKFVVATLVNTHEGDAIAPSMAALQDISRQVQ